MLQSLFEKLRLESTYVRSWFILTMDLCVSVFATLVSYLSIGSFVHAGDASHVHYFLLLLLAFLCSFAAFYLFRTYHTIIRHSSLRELWKLVVAVLLKECLMFMVL